MSVFSRFIHPIPSSRRAYSFFSSKSGGGRYFNSARPPKVANATDASKPPTDGASANGSSAKAPASDAQAGVKEDPTPAGRRAAASPSEALHHASPTGHSLFRMQHPAPSSEDYRLHQFFSLHRPLLLLEQPSASVFDSAPLSAFPTFAPAAGASASSLGPAPSTLDEAPEASPEADADAARLLARAIVMNRLGGTITFEAALRKLGLDLSEGRQRVEDMDLSALEVHLESTKRKRRSKMKKHK